MATNGGRDGADRARAERLLDGLDGPQVEAVTATGGPVVVLAGAGSGKTRVLTRRIAWRILTGQTDPERVLTLTFTRKAAAELRDRQRALGLRDRVPAGTFHSIALAQLRQRWTERGITQPKLLDRKIRFVAQLLGNRKAVDPIDIVAEIDWARARLVEPEGYGQAARAAGREPPVPAEHIAEAMIRYQQEKRRKRLVDFDDLLTLALRDLRADPDYAAAVRWRHRHFYVDEFQDVNPLQHALLQEWLGDRDDLFVVGDPNQAIYGWNGSDPNLLQDMSEDGEATVVRLDDNYRSTPQVLRLAAASLSDDRSGSRRFQLRAHRSPGPLPTVSAHPTDRAEAAAIAEVARHLKTGDRPWSDQAVLVRTNAQLVLIEEALTQVGIPARVRSGPGPLGSPEVKAELKVIGRDGIDLIQCLEELDERLAGLAERPPTGPAAERAANLTALSTLIHEYVITEDRPSGPGLLAWLTTMSHQGGSGGVDGIDAVDLSTFHGAKGLEWPIVHIAGLEDGFVPIAYASTAAQRAEERRLLYVALTRAEEHLHLSWAAERTFGVKTVGRDPSPHLANLTRTVDELRGGERGPVDWRAQIERTRSRIPGSEAADAVAVAGGSGSGVPGPSLLDELRRWRAARAKAAGVPGHVICDDRTLQAIAEAKPGSLGQLAALPGMRPGRLARWGEDLLGLVEADGAQPATTSNPA